MPSSNMKDAILIFGAGINQYTLIQAAKDLGLTTVVLDPNPEAVGKEIADYFYVVSGKDYETTKGIAIKHKIKGIVTSQMEKPLRLMAQLAQELGFIFHSPKVIERSLDKYLQKQIFLENKIPCAKGVLVGKDEEVDIHQLKKLGLPIILKPRDATSSQGVFKIDNYEEIDNYIHITRSFASKGEVIIEEFIDGPEFSIESITYKGNTIIVQYTEKFITPFPRTVEMGHLQPALLDEKEKKVISDVVIKAIKAIGIDNSASHTEVKLTVDGPKVVEIGARLGGDFISSYLVKESCGVDMDKAAIQVAIGEEPDFKKRSNKFSYIKYLELEKERKVKKIKDFKDSLKQKDVVLAHLYVKKGDIIHEITQGSERHGFVIVTGKSRSEVLDKGEKYCALLSQCVVLE